MHQTFSQMASEQEVLPAAEVEPPREGKVVRYNSEKSFGFIRPSDGASDVFMHISAVPAPPKILLMFCMQVNITF